VDSRDGLLGPAARVGRGVGQNFGVGSDESRLAWWAGS